jgi:transmembrane E3 ubiquitin-protein ligase
LTSNSETFTIARDLITARLEESVEKYNSHLSFDDTDTNYFFRPLQCDMIVFLSVLPISGITPHSLALYETEMRYPTGQSVVKPPAMELSGVMYSPDCGTALEWRDERAVKAEKFWHAGRIVGIVAGLIAGVQVRWVLREMNERGSPSVRIFGSQGY